MVNEKFISAFLQHLKFNNVEMKGTPSEFIENLQKQYSGEDISVLDFNDVFCIKNILDTQYELYFIHTTDDNKIKCIHTECDIDPNGHDREKIIAALLKEYSDDISSKEEDEDGTFRIFLKNGSITVSKERCDDKKKYVVDISYIDGLTIK